MITEIAQIDIKPGMEQEFEAGVSKAAPVFKRAKGCHGLVLEKSIEKPSRYRLFVQWETVENHTVEFPRQRRFPGMARLRRALLREPAAGSSHLRRTATGFRCDQPRGRGNGDAVKCDGGVHVTTHIYRLSPIATLAMSLGALAPMSANTAHAATCNAAPKPAAPRANTGTTARERNLGRKCWYLAAEGRKGQTAATRQAATDRMGCECATGSTADGGGAARLIEPLRSPPPAAPPAADAAIVAQATPSAPLPVSADAAQRSDEPAAATAPEPCRRRNLTAVQQPMERPAGPSANRQRRAHARAHQHDAILCLISHRNCCATHGFVHRTTAAPRI